MKVDCEHVEQVDGTWRIKVDGKFISCVSCGVPCEFVQRNGRLYMDHHCSTRHEGAKQGAQTRHGDKGQIYSPTYGQRLADGFAAVGNRLND